MHESLKKLTVAEVLSHTFIKQDTLDRQSKKNSLFQSKSFLQLLTETK